MPKSMIHIEEAEKSSRLQRLLWTKEYICLEDDNVMVESSFVLEDRYGNALKMVRAGLCWHTFVMAEYNSNCKTEREEVVIFGSRNHHVGSVSCKHEGLDHMELMWLLPLENIHLTVSKKASRHGLRVLRLRFCSGKLFHLELAEGTGARQIWGTWMHFVGELKKKHGPGFHETESHLTVSDLGKVEVNIWSQPREIKDDVPLISIGADKTHGKSSNALLSESHHRNNQKENESLAMHLVSHFKEHVSLSPANDSLHKFHHSISSPQIEGTLATEELTVQTSSSEVPTTESAGSAMSVISPQRLLEELDLASLPNICLCVGDLFGQFIFEAGTCGIPKRMASMSTMGHYIEADDCNMDSNDTHFGFGVEKESLRHCSSLPCVLDGEALFIEDLKQADNLTHQTSLAYLDLANDDDARQAHVINGHVMLITREESLLYKEVEKHRQQPMDLRFATARHPDVLRKTHKMKEKISLRRGAMVNISDKLNEQIQKLTHLHLSKHPSASSTTLDSHKRRESKKDKFKSFIKSMKAKKKRSRNIAVPPHPWHNNTSHVYEYVNEINIDAIARELTAIDSELFLRIHEAELIDCMWLKPERHYKAPNAMASIEFFHRLFGIVVTEILLPIQPEERAHLFAKFTRIAQRCLDLKNFHSTKAIIAAFQAPALQRLKDTWRCFQRMFPESYGLWENISMVMSHEGTGEIYTEQLRRAMDTPPCLPFIGTFLKQITEYYMRKLISNFYSPPQILQNASVSSRSVASSLPSSHHSTETSTLPNKRLHGDDDNFYTPSESGTDQADDLDETNQSLSSSADPTNMPPPSEKPTSRMTPARKRQIQFLIIRYAKNQAKLRGMTWNPKGHSNDQVTWDLLLDQTFDWSNIFKTVGSGKDDQGEPKHNFSDLKLMAEEQSTAGLSLETITSEPALTRTLFHFQLCVVRYKLESDRDVRDFLLKAHYNSDVENFALSLRREPPN